MDSEGSVTRWLGDLRAGSAGTAQRELWNRYFERLVGLARKRLGDAPRRVADEEDVVVSALNSFFEGMRAGAFPKLRDRSNLWPLLAKITARKAINQRIHEGAQKRGGGRVRGDSVGEAGASTHAAGLAQFPDEEPGPEFLAAMSEQCRYLLARLENADLRRIVHMKLAGWTNREIAESMEISERSVERKVALIRGVWRAELEE